MRIYYRFEQRDRFLVIFKAVPDRSHSIHFIDHLFRASVFSKKYVWACSPCLLYENGKNSVFTMHIHVAKIIILKITAVFVVCAFFDQSQTSCCSMNNFTFARYCIKTWLVRCVCVVRPLYWTIHQNCGRTIVFRPFSCNIQFFALKQSTSMKDQS